VRVLLPAQPGCPLNRCCFQDESIEMTDSRSAEDMRYEMACNRLANEAVRRLSADNVTVLLIAVKHS